MLGAAVIQGEVFRKEAEGFLQANSLTHPQSGKPMVLEVPFVRTNSGKMRNQTYDFLRSIHKSYGELRVVAFFCQGYRTGIDLGFRLSGKNRMEPDELDELAAVLYETCSGDLVVYVAASGEEGPEAMDPGPGSDRGFAESLRDACCRAGLPDVRVVAAERLGHATKNPTFRFFEGQGLERGGTAGEWVFQRYGSMWPQWVTWVGKSTNRFKFPLWNMDRTRTLP